MTRRVFDLSTLSWHLGQVPRQPFGHQTIDDRGQVTEWLPATVPGDVRADLIAAGRIPPVETPEGIATGAWVDDYDWWYAAALPSAPSRMDTLILEADGIDYYSTIWLDGHCLATHQGMFSRQSIVISPWANDPGTHDLAIRIWGGGALPQEHQSRFRGLLRGLIGKLSPGTEFFPDRMAVPKAQFSYGWDFAPRVLTAGIWDEMRLILCRGAYLEDVQVIPEPLSEGEDPVKVRWQLALQVRRIDPVSLRAEVLVSPEAGVAGEPKHRAAFRLGDDGFSRVALETRSIERWWPWDQGKPSLYRVTVRLLDGDTICDETEIVTGVRSVRRTAFRTGQPWRFVVNDRPIFLRGANWVPADVLPGRLKTHDYEELLQLARDAGINFLRVWGGGLREKRAFWEVCDRSGILAWQEFPLACAFLDHYPRDAAYLQVLAQEAAGSVKLLRNHPSLLAWCGGNEINPERERLPLQTIAGVLAAEDPGRPWIPASPSDGEAHEWDVWHGLAPMARLAALETPFLSEFGLQALPDAASVNQMFDKGVPPLTDPRWMLRKAQPSKLWHYSGTVAHSNIDAVIQATQQAQAAALQLGIEVCRIRRENEDSTAKARACGGVVFWQFNEPWPAVTWSVLDRYRRPKLAYEMLKTSFQPLLIAARFERRKWRAGESFEAEIWLVNDGRDVHNGCNVRAWQDGRLVLARDHVRLAGGSAVSCGTFRRALSAPPAELTLSLQKGREVIAFNRYDLSVYLPGNSTPLQWLRRRVSEWLLSH